VGETPGRVTRPPEGGLYVLKARPPPEGGLCVLKAGLKTRLYDWRDRAFGGEDVGKDPATGPASPDVPIEAK